MIQRVLGEDCRVAGLRSENWDLDRISRGFYGRRARNIDG